MRCRARHVCRQKSQLWAYVVLLRRLFWWAFLLIQWQILMRLWRWKKRALLYFSRTQSLLSQRLFPVIKSIEFPVETLFFLFSIESHKLSKLMFKNCTTSGDCTSICKKAVSFANLVCWMKILKKQVLKIACYLVGDPWIVRIRGQTETTLFEKPHYLSANKFD